MIHVACRIEDPRDADDHTGGKRQASPPDIKDKAVYELNELSDIVQSFCKIARTAEYGWPGLDTCCIDKNSNTKLQESIKIQLRVHVHLIPQCLPSSTYGCSCFIPARRAGEERLESTHKEYPEIDDAMDIDARALLVTFCPGMSGAREKLQCASKLVTNVQEDVAYSLFGIFGITLSFMARRSNMCLDGSCR